MSTTKLAANATAAAMSSAKLLDVVVIGGGLSGVVVAHGLHQNQLDWRLLEARSVLGGRLVNDTGGRKIDMGGAWIWPTHQPHMRALANMISTFAQPDDPSSTRIDGGAVQLVHRLAHDLPNERIQLNAPVQSCTLKRHHRTSPSVNQDDDDTTTQPVVEIQTTSGETFWARRVVWAVPPKIIHHENVVFDPPLSIQKQQAMKDSHTWMAGVTKIALVYPDPFWLRLGASSNMGLPSQLGPAFQMYDSSTIDGSTSALTFFALVVDSEDDGGGGGDQDDAALGKQVATQLQQVWKFMGKNEAAKQVHSYIEHYVQRWPRQRYISEGPKPQTIHPHPHHVPALSILEWDGLLQFAGSETDVSSPGVMEGAVGAAQRVLQELYKTL